jgi:hypothetical protein
MTDLERAAMVVNGLKKYAEKLLPNDRFAFSLALQEAEAAIRALPQGSAEPVPLLIDWDIESLRDLYDRLADAAGSAFVAGESTKHQLIDRAFIKKALVDAWQMIEHGLLPLYAHPPADEGRGRIARMQARLDDAESLINAAVEIMTFEQVGQWAGVRSWLEQDESDYLQPPDEKRAAHAEANPLGGPATMFETIAGRIRAGEEFYAVLADYGLSLNDHGGGCPDDASDKKDAERGRFLIANSVWHRHGNSTYMAVRVADGADLSCVAMRENAIDAAIAAAGKENGNA